ncbi:MAG TPA: DUF1259 domain-containing protein [Terriglobales bacterium]|nr:DUF1259 domain-containing protein [Terriglobales bacterium]
MRMRRLVCVLALCGCALAQTADWSAVEKALGRSGKQMPGGVYRFGMPRSDLDVKLDGIKLEAPFALGSWVAFQGDANSAMLMGDLVLTEREIQPVLAKLSASGIQISAIHNHVIGELPHVMYVHVGAHGNPVELAKSVRDALALTGTPNASAGAAGEPKLNFDRAAIEQAMGKTGTLAGDVLQFSFPRPEPIEEGGMKVSPAMGTGIAINFEAAGKGEIATTGDFVLQAEEVNKVIKALKSNGIEVTALHNHMLDENPRLFFLHFWGVGAPAKIAAAMRSGVDATAAAKK